MQLIQSSFSIFTFPKCGEAACVTTNGMRKYNGDAVMGAGVALEAQKNYLVADLLGKYLEQYGNRVFNLGLHPNLKTGDMFRLFSYPTKFNWKENSSLDLIEKSARELMQCCDKFSVERCYLPPVGCTNGRLNFFQDVEPIIKKILDDRFIIVLK